MKKDGEDIKVNRRSNDKIHFESTLIQQIADGIDFLRDESREILKELDINGIDELDLEEFGKDTMDQIDDIVDDISKFKSEVINSDDFPEFIKDYSKDAKKALNRDEDYVRRAKRKLNRMEFDDDFVDVYKTNIRVVELCDKAIDINYTNWEAYYLKALGLINLEKYDEAVNEAIKSLALNEDNSDAWLAIGDANRLNGKSYDAITVYDKALSIDEKSSDALKGKAYAYFDLNDYEKSDEFFKKSNSIRYLDEESMKTWGICVEKLNK